MAVAGVDNRGGRTARELEIRDVARPALCALDRAPARSLERCEGGRRRSTGQCPVGAAPGETRHRRPCSRRARPQHEAGRSSRRISSNGSCPGGQALRDRTMRAIARMVAAMLRVCPQSSSTPARSAASFIATHSSILIAMGFETMTCFPCPRLQSRARHGIGLASPPRPRPRWDSRTWLPPTCRSLLRTLPETPQGPAAVCRRPRSVGDAGGWQRLRATRTRRCRRRRFQSGEFDRTLANQ